MKSSHIFHTLIGLHLLVFILCSICPTGLCFIMCQIHEQPHHRLLVGGGGGGGSRQDEKNPRTSRLWIELQLIWFVVSDVFLRRLIFIPDYHPLSSSVFSPVICHQSFFFFFFYVAVYRLPFIFFHPLKWTFASCWSRFIPRVCLLEAANGASSIWSLHLTWFGQACFVNAQKSKRTFWTVHTQICSECIILFIKCGLIDCVQVWLCLTHSWRDAKMNLAVDQHESPHLTFWGRIETPSQEGHENCIESWSSELRISIHFQNLDLWWPWLSPSPCLAVLGFLHEKAGAFVLNLHLLWVG